MTSDHISNDKLPTVLTLDPCATMSLVIVLLARALALRGSPVPGEAITAHLGPTAAACHLTLLMHRMIVAKLHFGHVFSDTLRCSRIQ